MDTLPIELQDKIFLYLDFKTLKNTRILQSSYVKKTTESKTMFIAAENGNIDNMKWLLDNGFILNEYTFILAAKNGNLENIKWLQDNLKN
jgi:hypothetical protein